MSKTHSALTKESAIALVVLSGLVLLVVVNAVLLAPGLISLIFPAKSSANTNPINEETVKEAIQAVSP